MDINKFITDFIDATFAVGDEIDHGKLTLKEKAAKLSALRGEFSNRITEALNQEIDSALHVVQRYESKYNSIQEKNCSTAPAPSGNLLAHGEFKRNLDVGDKMVMLLMKLITDDLEDLKDRS